MKIKFNADVVIGLVLVWAAGVSAFGWVCGTGCMAAVYLLMPLDKHPWEFR